jgi:hypothetical protein
MPLAYWLEVRIKIQLVHLFLRWIIH